jgi:hypothetical protein
MSYKKHRTAKKNCLKINILGIQKTINWFEADPKHQIINHAPNLLIDKIISDYDKLFLNK